MRLDKYLADCGFGTRSEIKKLVRSGRVMVDGSVTSKPDTHIDENGTDILVDGVKTLYKKYIYLMLNKPEGYVSATYDKYKPTVAELIPSEYAHFEAFPVGRLDIDTTGILILTNDGETAHRLLSPTHHVPKKYIARTDLPITQRDVTAFSEGMDLGDFVAKPAKLTILDERLAEVTIHEGKFHQVKRMFEKVGKMVLSLKRIAMNKLYLDEELAVSETRELTEEELKLLTFGIR